MTEAIEGPNRSGASRASKEPPVGQFMARLKTERIRTWGVIAVSSILAFGLALYLTGKGFENFAGTSTIVDINVVLSLSLVISVTAAGVAGVIAVLKRREVRRLRQRNITLERNVRELQKRLRDANLDTGTSAGGSEV